MIFPPEIIEDTTESLFVRHNTRSRIIYLIVVISIAVMLVSLPFIYVEISTQASGVIRSPYENNQLQAAVYGEIIEIFITENAEVKKGDTLLILNSAYIQEQINRKEDYHGESYVDPKVAGKLLSSFQKRKEEQNVMLLLTQREKEVLFWLSQGFSNAEISHKIVLSEKTVKNHVSHLLKKLGLNDRTQAAVLAWRMGLAQNASTGSSN